MRASGVSVLLVPPPISTPGKLCRPRDRYRLGPQQGLPAHPILTVADHHFTRYPLALVTTHLSDDLGMLPDTCHAANAAECAKCDNCTVVLNASPFNAAESSPGYALRRQRAASGGFLPSEIVMS